ncbi:transcription factor SPT20 homolog [Xenia sp. Carnegie-2017]|uniref:transcription factor SPT20 homolog n=1 Tax=Xenia sp. Carnegie-2017 TaxID=2897299 RepID=UPI001F046A95|nr:transcription factor SPT20 homolog [Xenia sp. Carnegie-2017]
MVSENVTGKKSRYDTLDNTKKRQCKANTSKQDCSNVGLNCSKVLGIFTCQKFSHSVIFYTIILLFLLILLYIIRKLVSLPSFNVRHHSKKQNVTATSSGSQYKTGGSSTAKTFSTKRPNTNIFTTWSQNSSRVKEFDEEREKKSRIYERPKTHIQHLGEMGKELYQKSTQSPFSVLTNKNHPPLNVENIPDQGSFNGEHWYNSGVDENWGYIGTTGYGSSDSNIYNNAYNVDPNEWLSRGDLNQPTSNWRNLWDNWKGNPGTLDNYGTIKNWVNEPGSGFGWIKENDNSLENGNDIISPTSWNNLYNNYETNEWNEQREWNEQKEANDITQGKSMNTTGGNSQKAKSNNDHSSEYHVHRWPLNTQDEKRGHNSHKFKRKGKSKKSKTKTKKSKTKTKKMKKRKYIQITRIEKNHRLKHLHQKLNEKSKQALRQSDTENHYLTSKKNRRGKWELKMNPIKHCKHLKLSVPIGKVHLEKHYLHKTKKYKYTLFSCRYVKRHRSRHRRFKRFSEDSDDDDIIDDNKKENPEEQKRVCQKLQSITNGKIFLKKSNMKNGHDFYIVFLCGRNSSETERLYYHLRTHNGSFKTLTQTSLDLRQSRLGKKYISHQKQRKFMHRQKYIKKGKMRKMKGPHTHSNENDERINDVINNGKDDVMDHDETEHEHGKSYKKIDKKHKINDLRKHKTGDRTVTTRIHKNRFREKVKNINTDRKQLSSSISSDKKKFVYRNDDLDIDDIDDIDDTGFETDYLKNDRKPKNRETFKDDKHNQEFANDKQDDDLDDELDNDNIPKFHYKSNHLQEKTKFLPNNIDGELNDNFHNKHNDPEEKLRHEVDSHETGKNSSIPDSIFEAILKEQLFSKGYKITDNGALVNHKIQQQKENSNSQRLQNSRTSFNQNKPNPPSDLLHTFPLSAITPTVSTNKATKAPTDTGKKLQSQFARILEKFFEEHHAVDGKSPVDFTGISTTASAQTKQPTVSSTQIFSSSSPFLFTKSTSKNQLQQNPTHISHEQQNHQQKQQQLLKQQLQQRQQQQLLKQQLQQRQQQQLQKQQLQQRQQQQVQQQLLKQQLQQRQQQQLQKQQLQQRQQQQLQKQQLQQRQQQQLQKQQLQQYQEQQKQNQQQPYQQQQKQTQTIQQQRQLFQQKQFLPQKIYEQTEQQETKKIQLQQQYLQQNHLQQQQRQQQQQQRKQRVQLENYFINSMPTQFSQNSFVPGKGNYGTGTNPKQENVQRSYIPKAMPEIKTKPMKSFIQQPQSQMYRKNSYFYSPYSSSRNPSFVELPQTINILCFGDSLTSGFYNHGKGKHPYGIRLNQLLNTKGVNKYHVESRGMIGEMVHGGMVKRLPKVLNEGLRYDWILILGGTNDVAHVKNFGDDEDFTQQLISVWSPKIVKDIEKLHEIAKLHGARTVLMTIPETAYELWPAFQLIRNMRLAVNAALRRYATQVQDTTVLCDLAYKLPRSTLPEQLQKLYWNDHIHLNPIGYDKMAEIIEQCIEPYLH